MIYVMSDELFVERAKLAASVTTLYVSGCFGAPMTEYNKRRYMNNNSFNKAPNRQKLISAASPDTFGFDCICLIKAILWDWIANVNAVYGGATYKANGVPDFPVDGNANTKGLLDYCTEVSTDFSKIVPGEVLHNPGHAGIYIGDGLAIECTYRWKDGVQITAVANMGNNKKVANSRTWTEHGKLQWISYKKNVQQYSVVLDLVRYGSKGASVVLMQKLLNEWNMYDKAHFLTEDGVANTQTIKELRLYQDAQNLDADGVCGTKTWSALLGIEVTKL